VWARGDHLEVIKFNVNRDRDVDVESLSLTLADAKFLRHIVTNQEAILQGLMAFCMIYIQSPEGDTATALAESVLSECSHAMCLLLAMHADCFYC